MKAVIFFIFFTVLAAPTVFGQIKIGDNPQNIDASSVLELESTSKVLVITRVTTLEMEAITPQRGGMVYNTDTECINYYDGTQWVNLCDAVDFSITNDPIINGRSTIEITQTEGNINLEVAENSLTGDNIRDGFIDTNDIADNSLTADDLAAESVGSSEIRENAVGTNELAVGGILPVNIANDSPDRVLTTDENGIVQWEDTDGLYDLTFNKLDTTLTIARSTIAGVSTISLGALIGSDDQQLDLTDNILSIENDPNTVDLSTYLQELTINPAGTEISLSNGGTILLPPGTVDTDEQQLSIVGNRISLTDGGFVDLPPGTVDTDEQQLSIVGNRISLTDGGFVDIPEGNLSLDDGFIFVGNAASEPTPTAVGGDLTMNNIGEFTIEDAAVTPAKIEPALGVLTDDQVLITTIAGDVEWADYTPGGGGGADNQDASEVPYDPTVSGLTATTTQAAIDELVDNGLVDTNTTNATLTITDQDTDGTDDSLTITDSDGNIVSILLTEINSGTGTDTNTTVSTLTLTDEDTDGTDDSLTITDSAGNTVSILLSEINSGTDTNTTNSAFSLTDADTNGDVDTLTLTDSDNNTVDILLSEIDTNTLNTAFSITDADADGDDDTLTLTDSDNNTIDIPLTDIDTNTTNTAFSITDADADGDDDTLTLTDSENNTVNILLSEINSGANTTNTAFSITDADADGNDDTLTLTDSDNNTVDVLLTDIDTNTTNTAFSLTDANTDGTDDTLTLTDSENNTVSIALTDIDTNTINTAFSLTDTNTDGTDDTLTLTDSENNTVSIALTDIDTNTINTAFSLTDTNTDGTDDTLTLTDSENNTVNIPLADISTGTTNSSLTVVGTNLVLTDSEGATVTVALDDINTNYSAGPGLQLSLTNEFSIAPTSIQGSLNGGGVSSMIIPNSIGQGDIGFDAIGSGEISGNAVGLSEMKDDSVGSDEIIDGSITNADIGTGIDGNKIIPNFNAGIVTTGGLSVGDDILLNGNAVVPDYVFQKYFLGNSILNPSYKFKTLTEIEAFVKENNHLPGIQSAQAVKEQGFWNVSESSRVNLEKIEELFLHTIEQEKKIKELESANTNMSTELEALKAQMAEIKTMLLEKQNN
ncbi:hypothetical protein PXD56_15885 [Maribacter sp. SA7]|uniref:beta strand repeat-containing protein n=1 Tax=Maribacter zhoushanensis TaxID=3030012 RepID=UPI0023EC7BCC|nr:hypothetical protein [Maribacter zhoushanensis]MDF4204456.1 hypothetical protein [Maribacter zhoushanensis]